ncbi:MAG: hypothetical protein K0U39_01550 [Alphaproteobacteria bacterium]|nr:hypothetical protein [Alphaproteobacteria bacterium]
MMRLQKNFYGVICVALLLNGCASAFDGMSAALQGDTSIKGEVIGKVGSDAQNAPKRYLIINGSYADTLAEKHLLQQSSNPLTKLTYERFNFNKTYVQRILNQAGWQEVSPEEFLKDKRDVTIITMYATSWLHNPAPELPPILTPAQKAKLVAKGVGKGIGSSIITGGAGNNLEKGEPAVAYYYLVVGAFKTTHGNDKAKKPTELYWKTTAFFDRDVIFGEEDNRENYIRFMPVLARMIEPHLGESTSGPQQIEWPNQEIAQFKNQPVFYQDYGCESGIFSQDLHELKTEKMQLLEKAQKNLARTEKTQRGPALFASLFVHQTADLQQDVWDYEYGIATVSELITQKCS